MPDTKDKTTTTPPVTTPTVSAADKAASVAYTNPNLSAADKAASLNYKAVVPTSADIIAARKAKYGYLSSGGMVPKYFAAGGFARGTDTIPAMLTPGEFVMSRYAVNTHGVDTMKAMNSGSSAGSGDSVYNYNLSVNVKSDANPDDIARTVMTQIRQIDSQRIRGNRF
jgi:hypothetical protein